MPGVTGRLPMCKPNIAHLFPFCCAILVLAADGLRRRSGLQAAWTRTAIPRRDAPVGSALPLYRASRRVLIC